MSRLIKSYKTEINPTPEKNTKINKKIGTCRYMYNFYIAHNKELYDKGEKFLPLIKSGFVSKKADRYYVSVLVDIPESIVDNNLTYCAS